MKVNVEPNVKVVFNLTYEELLKRTHGNYTHKIFMSNDKVIDRILVEVFISEPQDIKVFEETMDERKLFQRTSAFNFIQFILLHFILNMNFFF